MRFKLPLSRLGIIAFIAAAGALVGSQIFNPTKRVLEAIGGVFLVYLIWNFSTLSALYLLLIIYPFPFAMSVGNSTFVFVLIIFIIYLIRVSARTSTIHFDRQFNLPIILIVMSYILSFYNYPSDPETLRFGLIHTINCFAAILFFYMIVNFVNDEHKLFTTIRVSMITCALVIVFTTLELAFPGRELIPGWLYTEHKMQLIMKGIRMGGPFHDFELNAEFFAMNVPIIIFLGIRVRRILTRSLFMLLFLADIVMLFSTMTRGAFISLTIGMVYLAYLSRRDLNFARFVLIAGGFVALAFIIDTVVATYTVSGSLFGRMVATTFKSGIVPENRVLAWGGAITRGFEHPFIGHGPGWDFSKGVDVGLWPHNVYLYYFNITGLFGLSAFIFLLVRLVQASWSGIRSSIVRDTFPEAFMKVLHVLIVMFIIDQIKIEYLRNDIYMYFIWFFFGLIAATRNVIRSNAAAARAKE
ncbi:MAG: O-antigen ligase family protein [Candidatus Krumholzibacteriaceae bacterium]|jgi:hypothetical protein